MSCKQPGRMQGVELQDCRVYPYQNQYSDIDNIPIFSTLNLQEGVMLMGLVASGGVSAGHNCSVSRYNFPLCIITGLACPGCSNHP